VFTWTKTDYTFLPKEILKQYHRKFGDVVLEKGYVNVKVMEGALRETSKQNQKISRYLFQNKLITESKLTKTLYEIKNTPYLDRDVLETL